MNGVSPRRTSPEYPANHVTARCSITHFLITDPTYRVCTTCPSVSLLPTRHRTPPIPVTDDGEDRDWKRFATEISRDQGDWMVQTALEAAVGCVMCGGRWMRTM